MSLIRLNRIATVAASRVQMRAAAAPATVVRVSTAAQPSSEQPLRGGDQAHETANYIPCRHGRGGCASSATAAAAGTAVMRCSGLCPSGSAFVGPRATSQRPGTQLRHLAPFEQSTLGTTSCARRAKKRTAFAASGGRPMRDELLVPAQRLSPNVSMQAAVQSMIALCPRRAGIPEQSEPRPFPKSIVGHTTQRMSYV